MAVGLLYFHVMIASRIRPMHPHNRLSPMTTRVPTPVASSTAFGCTAKAVIPSCSWSLASASCHPPHACRATGCGLITCNCMPTPSRARYCSCLPRVSHASTVYLCLNAHARALLWSTSDSALQAAMGDSEPRLLDRSERNGREQRPFSQQPISFIPTAMSPVSAGPEASSLLHAVLTTHCLPCAS